MEQERQKREGEVTDFQIPNVPSLCANSCGFFGNSATDNLCSKCYKDLVLSKSKAVESIVSLVENGKETGGNDVERKDLPSRIGSSSSTGGEELCFAPAVDVATRRNEKPSNRCSFCNKKVGLMGFKCRCDEVFCSVHRYSDQHNCSFDYKETGRDGIAKANPVVRADKVEKI